MASVRMAGRLQAIRPFEVMRILARARELEVDRDIVHMEIGEPDFPLAEPVRRAAEEALRHRSLGYTPSAGLPALREAVAAHYASLGADVPAERILITPGGSGALMLALALLADPGDRVVVPDPGYPCNRHFVHHLGAHPVAVPVDPESGYHLRTVDLESVRRQPGGRLAAAMVATPSNPAGTVIGPAALEALASWLGEQRAGLIVDEIYSGLTYDSAPTTALCLTPDVFVINSFSKYFGMTGWRLGWLVVPAGFEDAALRLAQNLYISASTPAQYAALACFSDEASAIFEQRRKAFAERRDLLLAGLPALGLQVPARPAGAFYVYARCDGLGRTAIDLCSEWLEVAGVAVTPGADFGEHRAGHALRFAYTSDRARIEEALQRLGHWLAGIPPVQRR